ncbi:hypothetical protein [Psychroserpens jangbogonensis]|uniref:hypothetical protein n=1 Tax=Psychroserpens jangbogonensis TaxID=1484460 RepID=UPI00053E8DC2|nr:hypothetical protein [Psychroserpens jangbogonensis]
MKIIHRFGYYLGGFSIGLVVLAFFLSGKKTSCDYGPDARTTKNISIKKKTYTDAAMITMSNFSLDTLIVSKLIRTGDVNFSESETKVEGCKTYLIENTYDDKDVEMRIKNCESTATILSIKFIDDN